MDDPKMLLAALAAIAAGLLIIGFISLDWRFFAASALASLVIIAVGIKAGGWRALNSFRQSPLKKLDDGNRDTLALLVDEPRTTCGPNLSFWHT